MKHTKFVSLLLLITILSTTILISCTDNNCGDNVSNVQTTSGDANGEGIIESEIKDNLPSDLDFGGADYRIYCNSSGTQNDYIQGFEEITGDIVYDTVIERNQKVEERLNVTFTYGVGSDAYNTVGTTVRTMVLSGDDEYDLIIAGQFGTCQLVTEGLFSNILEGKYFDFEQPWWWDDYMKEMSIGNDKSFFLVGDYFIDMLFGTRMLYFNKNIWNDYFGNPDDFYNLVLDGKWTIDTMTEYVKQVYNDLNGDGIKNDTDLWGYVTYWTGSSVDAFAFATDIPFTTRDSDGFITLTMYSEKAISFAEKLIDFFYCEGSYIYPLDKAGDTAKFMSGEALFLGNATFASTDTLREMDNDFGMAPNPKYDENQEKYSSVVHDTKNYGMIPITSNNLDMTSAVVEALCYESYISVIPAYYETALKIKYARDDISSQMIDLIHDSIMTDFIFVYYASLNNIGSIFRTLVTNKSSDFTSEYAKLETGALTALDKLVSAYVENN